MKGFKYITLGLVSVFLLQSCSEDKMDDINKNVNDPEFMKSEYIITDVMMASGFSITGSDLSFYADVYSELNAGGANQMYQAQIRGGEPYQASTYNNSWNTAYMQIKALKDIISKCSDGGTEQGNYNTLGVAQILYAYNFAILTDLFGDVPMSEAASKPVVFQPKLDKQEDIYKAIIANLKSGIENLNKESKYKNLGSQDLIFGGDYGLWEKTANGLLARYTMRLSLRQADYAGVISYVDQSFQSASEEFKLTAAPNPFARFARDRKGDLVFSKSLYDLILANGTKDLRSTVLIGKNGNGAIAPLDNSLATPPPSNTAYSTSAIMSEDNPIYLLSYHELLFLKAEAQARLGQDGPALETLKSAVVAAYSKDELRSLLGPVKAAEYTDTFGALSGNDLLKKIMVEKYISFYENEGIEAYNDVRRLKAMGNSDFIPLVNPNHDEFPLRFTYGQSDVTTNANVRAAFGDGKYVYKENVWWAGGTR